jgi:uncharacterized membrane protein YccC
MVAKVRPPGADSGEIDRREPAQYFLAFVIGAFVGAGLAGIWIPERRRRRLPEVARRRYRRVRRAGAAALDEIREAGREIAGEFRDELGASLEAAREEFGDMARQQLKHVRGTLRRDRRRLHD